MRHVCVVPWVCLAVGLAIGLGGCGSPPLRSVGGAIYGQVKDSATGQGISGVIVRASGLDMSLPVVEAPPASSDGSFRTPWVPLGAYEITLKKVPPTHNPPGPLPIQRVVVRDVEMTIRLDAIQPNP